MPSRTFSSRIGNIPPVQDAVLEELEAAGYPEKCRFAVKLALDEAMANAVRHGNHNDPDQTVTVDWEVAEDRVTIHIEDCGCGFEPAALPDPTAEENLHRPHGRGVMLMKAYMTQVLFNEAGNRVTLMKRRDCTLPR
ncbi:ATP-binding protein [Phycisphaera mikurensis]|uniref:Putative anti-sigma factor n=1 Tax=Phycisphaera mikurensis (strain NBRC 102666 / KCTC 22515 / FYK2301M01) TaxID=1142394 RepID=I0IEC1_PHYMF|nr:ATP-binding protein [Phycisphaera mikurensis]MBB6441409.1 serine/threonine-protein kinase RsbW [Phycisphaera mikurensis]BAM03609.1 putative anti-sigma factor [Phycisphaera mikurensis NBRC 102666]